jgi:hypothetical protein
MGFFEIAVLIQGPRKNLFISMRPSNSLLEFLKDILKLTAEMTSSANEPIGNNESCNKCCLIICFQINYKVNGSDDISAEELFENSKPRR